MRTSTAGMLAAGLCGVLASPLVAAPAATADGKQDLRYDQPGLEVVGAADVWEQNRGSGITVAVLDTGVDASHPDLDGQVTTGEDVTGQDLASGDNGYGENGTGVAGIIAASGHGQEHTGGIMGVAPEAGILSVRVAADEGSGVDGAAPTDDSLQQGVEYAVTEGARVITLPAGASGGDTVREAVASAVHHGALVVAPGASPLADDENVFSVGAVDNDLLPMSDSANGVQLRAPGSDVATLAPNRGYTRMNGDSAATAFVAGAAALVRAEHPQLLPDQVTDALVSGAQPATGGADADVLHLPDAAAEAARTAEDIPLYDEDLIEGHGDPLVPVWAWWAGGALLLVTAIVVVFRILRPRSDPYGLAAPKGSDTGAELEDAASGKFGGRQRGRRRAARG